MKILRHKAQTHLFLTYFDDLHPCIKDILVPPFGSQQIMFVHGYLNNSVKYKDWVDSSFILIFDLQIMKLYQGHDSSYSSLTSFSGTFAVPVLWNLLHYHSENLSHITVMIQVKFFCLSVQQLITKCTVFKRSWKSVRPVMKYGITNKKCKRRYNELGVTGKNNQ